MKKVLTIIEIFIIFLILYFLQANFFSWYNIGGIKPNLFIVLALFIGLFMGKTYGLISGVIFGILLDFFIGKRVGITSIGLGLVGILGGILDKNFSKESRITLMTMVLTSSVIYEVIIYSLKILIMGTAIEVLPFIKILLIETVFNLIITIVIYNKFQKFGEYIQGIYSDDNNFMKHF